ncbi:hypothetical protein QNI19_12890 [Cytophagaceae bacterium DM2B3-1]|uniref:Uncharacterized protein n=1 Tax=Xanthocytophaga flava TaxID=3048013 RepID=A0ABT7CJC3_9BACT|nr:hypothetical protein [Xanthocytophaga flavus]MDJ1467752.1 hypothetical protein [Xanthocytophaga flavus]MDJ1493831.1 hypothetical protein [Xanthocytophaga flavus]
MKHTVPKSIGETLLLLLFSLVSTMIRYDHYVCDMKFVRERSSVPPHQIKPLHETLDSVLRKENFK